MKDAGKEGRRRGDHEWNFRDRIAAERIDIQQCGAEAGWDTYIERVGLHTHGDQDAPKDCIHEHGYNLQNLLPHLGIFEGRGWWGSDLSCSARETFWWVMGHRGRGELRRGYGDRVW